MCCACGLASFRSTDFIVPLKNTLKPSLVVVIVYDHVQATDTHVPLSWNSIIWYY